MRSWLIALLPLGVACSSFGGESGPTSDAGPSETTSVSRDAGTAKVDEVAPDAEAGPFVCPPAAAECLTFDGPPPSGWEPRGTEPPRFEGGIMTSRIETVTVDGQGDVRLSRLEYDLSHTSDQPAHTKLSFLVKVDSAVIEGPNQVTLAELYCDNDGGDFAGVLVNVLAGLEIGGTPLAKKAIPFALEGGSARLTTGKWLAMHLDVVWAGTRAGYVFSIGDAVVSKGVLGPENNCLKKKNLRIALGLGSGSNQSASATYDDVVVEHLSE